MRGKFARVRYGEARAPINRQAAVVVGLVGKRQDRPSTSMSDDFSVAMESLHRVLGVPFELAAKCLCNRLDKYELKEMQDSHARRITQPLSEEELKVINYAIRQCPALVPDNPILKKQTGQCSRRQHEHARKRLSANDTSWKVSRTCPDCGKYCLRKDFRYCPMCGIELPQDD